MEGWAEEEEEYGAAVDMSVQGDLILVSRRPRMKEI